MTARIPGSAKFLPCAARFRANYGVQVPAKYSWDNIDNTGRRMQRVYPNRYYCIAILNNSATVPESAYLVNSEVTPQVTFGLETTNPLIFGRAYELGNYLVNNEMYAYFKTDQGEDWLTATVKGVLGQGSDLVGFAYIDIVLSLNLFEITDRDFMRYLDQLPIDAAPGLASVPPEWDGRI